MRHSHRQNQHQPKVRRGRKFSNGWEGNGLPVGRTFTDKSDFRQLPHPCQITVKDGRVVERREAYSGQREDAGVVRGKDGHIQEVRKPGVWASKNYVVFRYADPDHKPTSIAHQMRLAGYDW